MEHLDLYDQIQRLPDDLKREASDFVAFLAEKAGKGKDKPKPVLGSGKGTFIMMPGFDDPLEDFKDYM